MKKFLVACMLCVFLAACGVGNTNTTYRRGQIGKVGSTKTGVIVSMEVIQTEGSELLGTAVGGVAGGLAGSAIGGGTGQDLAILGGALVGGIAGNLAEKAITSDTAYEFLVQLDRTGEVIPVVQSNELQLQPGDHVILVKMDGVTRIRRKFTSYR